MRLPFPAAYIDERFLMHRLRSSSLAGMLSASLALGLFAYRYYHDGQWSNDLLAVGILFVAVKLAILVWSRIKD